MFASRARFVAGDAARVTRTALRLSCVPLQLRPSDNERPPNADGW